MVYRTTFSRQLWCRLLILLVVCGGGAGCQTARYYHQAARGQWQILRERQPITEVIANPATPPAIKEKLHLILQLREFAENQLALPVRDQYRRYVHLDRRYAVWNVHAAPRFSLSPK